MLSANSETDPTLIVSSLDVSERSGKRFREMAQNINNSSQMENTSSNSVCEIEHRDEITLDDTIITCSCGEPAISNGMCISCNSNKANKKDVSFNWSDGWDADREWNHNFPPQGKTSKNSIIKMAQGTYVPDEKAKWSESWNNFTLIISKDSGTEAGTKSFRASQQGHEEFINFMLSRTYSDRYYYEIIPELRPVKLYYDLETDPTKEQMKTEIEWDAMKTALITRTIQALERYFPKEYKEVGGISHDDFVVLNSSGKDSKKNDIEKSSYHVVLAHKLAFTNMEHLNTFLKESKLLNPMSCSMIDKSVYKTHSQSFRIACNIKKNDPHNRFLVIEECPGFSKEDCKAAYSKGRQKIKKGKLPPVKKHVNMLKKMILDSMLTYIPAEMEILEIDKKKMDKQRKECEKIAKENINKDPDAFPPSASSEDILVSMCKALVESDINYVTNYDEWIRIGRLLWSAGARENVWLEFSNMAPDAAPEEALIRQWRYFGQQNLTNDPEMFYNFVKARCPKAVDDARMLSIDRMDSTPASIAQTMATLYGDKVVFDAGSWYYREGVHWRQDPETRRLGEIIMTDFQREISQKIRFLKQKNKELEEEAGDKEGGDTPEIALNAKRIENYNDIKKLTGAGRIGSDWYPLKTFFARPHFSERLDERMSVLAFDNGIIDLHGSPVKDEKGAEVRVPLMTKDGHPRINIETGKVKTVQKRAGTDFELREPEEYIDDEGKPRMEFIQKSCGYNYVSKNTIFSSATGPEVREAYLRNRDNFNRYMGQVFPDPKLRNYILFFLATALDGSISFQEFNIWTGISKQQNGSNSKSFLKTIIEQVFGDYANTCSPQILTRSEPSANQANSALMKLKGLRLAFFDEPETGTELQVPIIKRLTGGDKISTRELHSTQITFRVQAKLALLCNEIPPIATKDRDDGLWRRLKICPFTAKFVDNPDESKWAGLDNLHKRDNDLEKEIIEWRLPIIHTLLECYAIFNTPRGEEIVIEERPGKKTKHKGLGKKLPKCKLLDEQIEDFKNDDNVIKDWLDENIIQDPQGILTWKELKTVKNDAIKNIYRGKGDGKIISEISNPSGGGLGNFIGHSRYSIKKDKWSSYTRPCDGKQFKECWGGWRMKTDEERQFEEMEEESRGSVPLGNSTSGIFLGGDEEEGAFD